MTVTNLTQTVNQKPETIPQELQPVVKAAQQLKSKICAVAAIGDPANDLIDSCSIPDFQNTDYEIPECPPGLSVILGQHKQLFIMKPGKAEGTYHNIPTSGCPVKVPPRRIPAHYKEEVEKQIQIMLDNHIIEPSSSSPWMSPAVFVRKKTGDIRLCVDYRELNKRTTHDAYPLPLPDEVQDWLAGSSIFSTLDLQSGYWQLPVNPADKDKTAFCPGPGMGVFQFLRMPFGLSGAPSSFQ